MNASFDTTRYNAENDAAPDARRINWPAERVVNPIPEGWVNPCDGAAKCRRGWMGGCGPGCKNAGQPMEART